MLLYAEKTSYVSICREDQLCFYRIPAILIYVEKTSYAFICRGEDQLCFFL